MPVCLFARLAPPPGDPPPRLRVVRHPCPQYVRKVKGARFQLRWWLEGHGSVNCGLYASEEVAGRVRGMVLRRTGTAPPTPLSLWAVACGVLAELRAAGHPGLPARDPPPKYARRAPRGGWLVRFRCRGRAVELPGPFDCPREAHRAALAELARLFPPPVPRRRWVRVTLFGRECG